MAILTILLKITLLPCSKHLKKQIHSEQNGGKLTKNINKKSMIGSIVILKLYFKSVSDLPVCF